MPKPFDDPDWVFEIKHDGFRALALIEKGHCWLVSRRKHKFHAFGDLAAALGREVQADMAILDGELAVADGSDRSLFASIMKRRKDVRYHAFDLFWLSGKDLRGLPLLARKQTLQRILPASSAHVRYVDHMRGSGTKLYELACQFYLEGVVGKKADSPYEDSWSDPHWVKIKNPNYSQKEGRSDLFKRGG